MAKARIFGVAYGRPEGRPFQSLTSSELVARSSEFVARNPLLLRRRGQRVRLRDPRIPLPRFLHRSLLRFEINVGQTEALAIAFSPLEVIEQAPRMIAADVRAILDSAREFPEVVVIERDSPGIVNRAVFTRSIGVGAAILR